MQRIIVGCAGFDYKDWVGPFYPKKLEKFQHLSYYAKFFEIVEINSTFYNLPSEDTVIKWTEKVPKSFRFIVKLWQEITHIKSNIDDLEDRISQFLNRMRPMEDKISAFLIQFPPWFKYSKDHLHKLLHLLNEISFNDDVKYIIELRDNSWFKHEILTQFIDGEHKILGTTYMPKVSPYYLLNQNNYYIRLIGDRELTVFNRIQREQKESMTNLNENIKKLINEPSIKEIFIIVNNHFAGFAPEMVNRIKKMFDLPIKQFSKQKNMSDFI